MFFKCNNTGSKGNSYYIQAKNNKILLLECGICERGIMNGVPIHLVDGLFVSHNHCDHNTNTYTKGLMSNKFKEMGIPTYTVDDMEENELIDLDTFKIIPIEMKHNVKCYGCLIMVDGLKILFATDTNIIPEIENVKVDYFIIECNFQEELLKQRIDNLIEKNNGSYEITRLRDVYNNHCSLETLQRYFKNLGYKPKGIYTIHLSNSGLGVVEDIEETLKQYCDDVRVIRKGSRVEC